MDGDEGFRESTDPAHFESLESEVHVGFMDTTEMAVEKGIEGVERLFFVIPGETVDCSIGNRPSGVVCDSIGKRDEDITEDSGAGLALGVLAGSVEVFVQLRMKHGIQGCIA